MVPVGEHNTRPCGPRQVALGFTPAIDSDGGAWPLSVPRSAASRGEAIAISPRPRDGTSPDCLSPRRLTALDVITSNWQRERWHIRFTTSRVYNKTATVPDPTSAQTPAD